MTRHQNTAAYAQQMDKADPLARRRAEFRMPQRRGNDLIYFCGNSLGLQPIKVQSQIAAELNKWADHGVEGHFKTDDPWIDYHQHLKKKMGAIVGADAEEIAVMNSLTVNIHLMMVSFYRPSGKRHKIICEAGSFPSDLYTISSQAAFRGLDPADVLIELAPRAGEEVLRNEDILEAIDQCGEELALIWMGGVNYYTGQAFDMKAITAAAHGAGALAGFDLAHAAGNIELQLHDWNIDFAAWCTYKYLNSGPGGIGAVFVHSKHGSNPELPRFAGWWGNELSSRFLMRKDFEPAKGADGWCLSTAPILLMAPLRASLEIFDEVGFENLLAKQRQLTDYLEFVLNGIAEKFPGSLRIITPADSGQRGAQLSIAVGREGKEVFYALAEKGVVADWREPEVIRLAPAPLYNSYTEVYQFGSILSEILRDRAASFNKKQCSFIAQPQ